MEGRRTRESFASDARELRKKAVAQRCVARVRAMRQSMLLERRRLIVTNTSENHTHAHNGGHMSEKHVVHTQPGPRYPQHGLQGDQRWKDEAEAEELRADVAGLIRQELEADGVKVDADELISLEEQLMREILAEEAAALVELEAAEREREIEHYANEHSRFGMQRQVHAAVLCPFCSASNLHQTMSAFHCQCGFRFDARQDCATLSQLRERLATSFESHARHALSATGHPCSNKPAVGLQDKFGVQLLTMECQNCKFLHVIL